eukprot:TRINITY_DN2702_c0_g1_i4.p1 TRINITY_DN2702_c0_g1~~TRINITY_DN2702_c0_g1_i4.p1  ORF type:complete len:259 (-),score=70.42 TRINITY_DN2702_c0_g1_i4:241-960(-)
MCIRDRLIMALKSPSPTTSSTTLDEQSCSPTKDVDVQSTKLHEIISALEIEKKNAVAELQMKALLIQELQTKYGDEREALRTRITHLEKSLDGILSENENLKMTVSNLQANHQMMKAQFDSNLEELRKFREESSRTFELEQKLSEISSSVSAVEDKARTEVEIANEKLAVLKASVAPLQEEVSELHKALEELERQNNLYRDHLRHKEEEIAKLRVLYDEAVTEKALVLKSSMIVLCSAS